MRKRNRSGDRYHGYLYTSLNAVQNSNVTRPDTANAVNGNGGGQWLEKQHLAIESQNRKTPSCATTQRKIMEVRAD